MHSFLEMALSQKWKKLLLHESAILAGHDLNKKKIHFEDNQALEQVAQAACVVPIFGGFQTDKALIKLVWTQSLPCFERMWD